MGDDSPLSSIRNRPARIARDPEGNERWLTPEKAAEVERAALMTERAAKEAALVRIAELERKLGGGT